MSAYIPKVRLRRVQTPKWFNGALCHQRNCLRTLTARAENHPSEQILARLAKAKSDFSTAVSDAKAKYENSLTEEFQSSRASGIFKYIGFLRDSGSIPSTVFYRGCSASTDADRACIFNTFILFLQIVILISLFLMTYLLIRTTWTTSNSVLVFLSNLDPTPSRSEVLLNCSL